VLKSVNLFNRESNTVAKSVAKLNRPDSDPSRLKFIEFCDNFPIDFFKISRPLRTTLYGKVEFSDSQCAFMALSSLGVPHDSVLYPELEPIGWIRGPHLLEKRLNKDWNIAFGTLDVAERLKTDPSLLLNDSSIQLAIAFLRYLCERGTPSESKTAKHILKELKLPLFIPEKAQKRRTDDLTLRFYDSRPIYLLSAVYLYEFVIKQYLEHPYKRGDSDRKEADINKAFKYIFKVDMPDKLFSEGERDKDNKAIALAFIHFETGAPYEALKQLFYDHSKSFFIF